MALRVIPVALYVCGAFALYIRAPQASTAVNATGPGAISVDVPSSVPANASPQIDPSFASFAFEETSWPLYIGAPGSPNTFSVNLFNQITSRTNTVPYIRVGGTSLDQARYVATQQEAVSFPAGQSGNVPKGVTLGPSYFGSFPNLPSAKYIFCLPLAANNLSNTVEFAKAAYPTLQSQLYQLEIGNEPQSYPGSVRPASYTVQDYIRQFTRFSNAVNAALGISSTTPIYEAIALGSPDSNSVSPNPAPTTGTFYPSQIFPEGLSALTPRFGSVSMHYYQTFGYTDRDGADQLRTDLMNHTATTSKMSFFQPAISYLAANYPNLRLNLAEVASSLNGDTNDYALEQTFGAALWLADMLLWSMSIGVNRVSYQQIAASAFDLWQPVTYKDRPPAVLPPYYGMLFATDFIGTSGSTRVANIDLKSDYFVAYAAYEGSSLARVALINLNFFSGSESSSNARPTQFFVLTPPAGTTSVNVRYLSATTGATASSERALSWAGQQWTVLNNGLPSRVAPRVATFQVGRNGKVSIPVKASEAALVDF